MENRLFRQQQLLPLLMIVVCTLCFSTFLSAQSFTLNYTGEDTLYVGNNCTTILDWGDPATVSFTAESGNKIDTFYIDNISGGFEIGDAVRAPRSVSISYYVEDTTGFSETLQSVLRIVIADSTKPVFDLTTLPKDTTYADANDIPQPPSVSTIMASDNCGIASIFYNGETDRPTNCGSFTRSWSALDTAQNTTIYTQTIILAADTTAPVWNTNPMDIDIACDISIEIADTITNWLAVNGNGVVSDASSFSVTHDFTGLDSCGFTGNAMVTFTAIDDCGNTSMASGMINIADTIAPNINIGAKDTTVFLGDAFTLNDWLAIQGGAVATDFCTAIDNSDTSAHWSVVDVNTTQSCGNNTTYEAIFVVMDDCGNADSTMAIYTAADTTGLSISGILGDRTAACGASNDRQRVEQFLIAIRNFNYVDADSNELDFVEINYTGRDGATGRYVSVVIPFDNTFIPLHDCNWFLTAELVVKDSCGNLARDTAIFSFIDTIQPTIIEVPMDTTLSCEQLLPGTTTDISVIDNCDTSVTITLLETSDTTLSTINITRTWIAIDDCDNRDSAAQLITVIDTIAPMLGEIPRDTIATCDDIPVVPLIIDATDNCTALEDLVFEFDETNDQLTHPDSCQTYNYTITRTWKVTDAFNNIDSAVQIITVVDTMEPTFTKPLDITISCEFRDSLSITGEPTNLMDNCDTLPNVIFVDLVIGGDCVGGGALDTIVRTWTVMDACGNASDSIQKIILIDTTAPIITGLVTDVTIQCNGATVPLPVIGTDITATDNCGNTPIIQYIGETNTQSTDPDACDFYNYTITRTWRATDACGNAADFIQNINIVDTIAPTIICPIDMEIESSANSCAAMVTLPKPFYFDACTGEAGTDSLVMTQNFTNPTGDDINEIPVDSIIFNFNIGAAAPDKTITSDVVLTINLNSVDGEGANEIFSIIGEDGTVFGGTNPAQAQCGNSTTIITLGAALANEYAKDSIITIMLNPNGNGTEAINNICTGGNANAVLEYTFEAASKSIMLTYSVDGGAISDLIASPMTLLDEGDHIITYYATDCSGNTDSCAYQVTIIDKTAPTFDCPTAITAYVDASNCEATVTLPFPSNFADNCGSFNDYNSTQAEFISFKTDANVGQVPNDISRTFSLNSPNAIGDGTLTVAFLGDSRDTGEFFNIYGENGVLLGTTILGDSLSECSATVSTVFTISQDTLNAWAADGEITINAIPNLDAVNFSDFINPCNSNLNTNQTDGNSVISINLNFPTVFVNYTVADSNDIVLQSGMLLSPAISVSEGFQVGMNRVTYMIADAAGNTAACLYTVEVKDTIAPVIVCKDNFIVQANPSGDTTDLSLLVDSLVTSISDNCGIESISISPNKVSCADVGMMTVAITVTDSAGNTATCQSIIEVGVESITPNFSVGVCNNDALFLFADTTFQTATSSTSTFTYNWSGPNNFTSTEKNPIIPNVGTDNSGNYTLTITGPTGCAIAGTIFINISNIDVPLLNTASSTVCTSDGITLTTSAANCTNLEYQWFEIVNREAPLADTIMLIGTSVIPSFSIENPTAGSHSYYLIVECDDCTSLGSEIVSVTAFEVPTAITGTPIVNICEGEDIILSSPLTDQTCTYSWVGPGFTSNLPTPAPIENAAETDEGVYTLTVSKNGCISEEAFTVVNITNRPAQPNIANESGTIICEGSELVLKTDVLNANTYTWTNTTTFASFTTTAPELRIDTTKLTDEGMWNVMVESANCTSMPSTAVAVQIEAKPNGTPFFEGPACDGRMFKLNANPVIAGAGYEWTDASGTVYLGASPEVPVQSEYTLSITSVNGCVTQKTLPIEVQVTPVITTLFDSGDADPCIVPEDTDIQIIGDVFPANDGTYTFSWTTPDGNMMAPMPDSMLVIPNAVASAVNGTYTLVVNTGAGCQSNPVSTIVETVDIPVPNPVIMANETNLCEGQTLMITATEYPNISAEYRWQITSIMDTITASPILILDSVTTALNGVVTLQVFNGACPSVGTATLPIRVNSLLAQPTINASTNFCAGESITLTTTEVSDATYLWEGPNFTATTSTPDIVVAASAEIQNNGGYTVQILSNNCTSPKSEPLILTVNEVPNAPIANNSGDICLANTTDIILFIDEENVPAGVEYRWYDVATGAVVAGPNSFKSQIIEASNLPEGVYQFYATQTLNSCESAISNITEVTIANIPNELAQVCSGDMTICDIDNAVICALAPSQGIGTWTTADANVVIDNPNSPETSLSGLLPGSTYTFFWRLSNGVCGEYSAARLIVEVGVAGAVAQVCTPTIEACEGTTVNLCANPVPTGFNGKWSQPESQAELGVTINDVAASNTTVSTIEPGNPFNEYTFYWTVIDDQGICSGADTMKVKVYEIPDDIALIADTELISCNGEAVVTANAIPNGLTGNWSSSNPAIIIATPNNATTDISNLSPGMNTLVWSLQSGACTDFSSDELIVFFEEMPEAMDDVYDIGFSSGSLLNVTENDQIFSPDYEISLLSAPMNGTAIVTTNGQVNYTADENFVGTDFFTYELCNPTCASDCSTAQVELKVGEDASCIIPTIMTPNNDGVNDVFMIPCIETGNFPGNEVIIFNQWGDEIYRSAPYTNNWRGTYNGEDIPAGTYYYVISFDRNTEPTAGFLIIER